MRVDTGRLRVVPLEALEPDADLDLDAPSPGAYLSKQRQRQGISLEQLAVATRIPMRSLQFLEQDRYEELPGPVFVKGFLRCSARALGVSADAVMELLYERERAALVARRAPRAVTGSHAAAGTIPVSSRVPPRVAGRSQSGPGPLARVVAALPGPQALLWLMVAVLVGFLVLAAFNLVGSGSVGRPS